jgi:hypothetical protein
MGKYSLIASVQFARKYFQFEFVDRGKYLRYKTSDEKSGEK